VHVTLKDHSQVPTGTELGPIIGQGEQSSRIIPKALGRFHIGAVEPGNQDGVSGIHVNGTFYPDEQVHSVDYVKDAGAPKKMTANGAEDMSLDEQREWYDKSEQEVKDSLASEADAATRAQSRANTRDEIAFGLRPDPAVAERARSRAAQVEKYGEDVVSNREHDIAHRSRIEDALKMHGLKLPSYNVREESLESAAVRGGLTKEHLEKYDALIEARRANGVYEKSYNHDPTKNLKHRWFPPL